MARDPLQFCVRILPAVSRTFAVNIRVLKGDLHHAVLTAYLFCRIVDTAEDSEDIPAQLRVALLDSYGSIFASRKFDSATINTWVGSWHNLDPDNPEHQLIAGLQDVVNVFLTLPVEVQSPIAECVAEMAQGMRETVERRRQQQNSLFVLQTFEELKRYCHYVAGTVGHLLTRLFTYYTPDLEPVNHERLLTLGPSFALGLQLTNIIKDCRADHLRGWCYIPADRLADFGINAEEMFNPAFAQPAIDTLNSLMRTTAACLEEALEYTLTLPSSEVRMRLFNLWSLFFAIRTLRAAWNNPALLDASRKVKISRFEVYLTLVQTSLCVRSDRALRRLFRGLRSTIPR
jgi:farnesyl-diphosphate farnesyltransferase